MPSQRTALFLLFLASIAVLATVLLAQYVGGLQPCELCYDERWPYYAVALLTLFALLIRRPSFGTAMLKLSALIFAAGTLLGAYHVGVEQHWIAGPSACTGDLSRANSIAALQQALEARQPVPCDVVQWSLHGISLAGLDFIAALLLMLFAFGAARYGRRPRR